MTAAFYEDQLAERRRRWESAGMPAPDAFEPEVVEDPAPMPVIFAFKALIVPDDKPSCDGCGYRLERCGCGIEYRGGPQ